MTEPAEIKAEDSKDTENKDVIEPLTDTELGEIKDAVKTQQYIKDYDIAGRKYSLNLLSSKDEEEWKLERTIFMAGLVDKVNATRKTDKISPEIMKMLEAPLDLFDQREVVKRQLVSIDGTKVNKEEIANLFDSGAISSELLNTLALISHGHRSKFIDLVTRSITSEDNIKKS
jgi:hypothetical protein